MDKNARLHDKIIEKAGELFREQGYAATSIKQIAKAVGCTNAALYYYFEGGKQHILQEVIHQPTVEQPELATAVAEAHDLASFLLQLSQTLDRITPQMAGQFNWLLLQFPTLPDEEQQIIQQRILDFHRDLNEQISCFVADEDTADKLTWFIFCSIYGYQQIFSNMHMSEVVDMNWNTFGLFMAETLS